MTHTLKNLIKQMVELKGSDLHISIGIPPQIRVDGVLQAASDQALNPKEAQTLCTEYLSPDQIAHLESERELDLSFDVEGSTRIRGNIFWSMGQMVGAFRAIPYEIPTPETLGLPPTVINLINKPRGLILVTGQTGSGKSTTIASLLELINKTRSEHIITVEDPVEYVFQQKKCTINQREINSDTHSFVKALKYILRQDPDHVLIGEMRDLETIKSAITIAETGHLVFATLHTNNAVQTINRVIDVFPPHQQDQIRTQLSFILEGVISQQLLPKINRGRALAVELMLPTSGIRNLIREGKIHQIMAEIQMNQQSTHMVTMDQSLAKLVKSGIIEQAEAMKHCLDVHELNTYLSS
ncbi:MAG: type IV pilus twitching motility protein PilT [Pseudomonadota bacterium]